MMEDFSSYDGLIDSVAARFGYTNLKAEQRNAVRSFLTRRDVFVCLPTGFGKSICYTPAIFETLYPWTCNIIIVISPLTSLMRDQVDTCSKLGISAVAATKEDESYSFDHIANGNYQIIYVSPEMVRGPRNGGSSYKIVPFSQYSGQ